MNSRGSCSIALVLKLTGQVFLKDQVKALLKRSPVPLGGNVERLFGDSSLFVARFVRMRRNVLFLCPAKCVSLHTRAGRTASQVIGFNQGSMKPMIFENAGTGLIKFNQGNIVYKSPN
jgi:hypothetical protein